MVGQGAVGLVRVWLHSKEWQLDEYSKGGRDQFNSSAVFESSNWDGWNARPIGP